MSDKVGSEMNTEGVTGQPPGKEPIAIIGIGCRFPGGVNSPQAFWQLLRDEVDAITEIPGDRIDVDTYYDPRPATAGKMMTRWGGFLEQIDQFDAYFFGISPREADRLDPQQRLLLEVAWEALEDAGLVADKLVGSPTGIFIGMWLNDYEARMFADPASIDFYMTTGSGRYSASGRISYNLGFQGPSLTVDTACSSSLVATHLACQSLRSGECALALAGGANVILQPHISIAYSQSKMMAPDGRCKFGDARADGYVRSEGAGVVVLKLLSRALVDGDPIYAVIRGSAVTNDGRSSGFLATPGRAGQEEVLRRAYQDAGIAPSQVQYIEAHGTGTRAGDPVELEALGAVLAVGRPQGRPCAVGSVKTNFGHTEGAAGIAGLIKTALALKHRAIPASLHLQEPNPSVPWQSLNLVVPTKLTPWPDDVELAAAGISSFGIAGTNAHVILAEAPATVSAHQTGDHANGARLLPLSAHTPEALAALARAYKAFIAADTPPSLEDISYSAACHRTHHPHRLALAAESHAEMAAQLDAFLQGEMPLGDSFDEKEAGHHHKVVYVFPGQGSQWYGMGRQLLADEPVFRRALEECEQAMRPFVDWSLLEQLTIDQTSPSYRLDEIDVIQPTLLSIEIALARLWRSWGVEPDAVIGHSMGEVAAAHIAGALSLEDAMRIICRRSSLLRRVSGQGAMAVVGLPLAQADEALDNYRECLSIAVSNSPRSTVLSGDPAALEEVLNKLAAQNIFCRPIQVDVASHSPQMDPLRPDLLHALDGLQPQAASVPIYSTVTGEASDGATFDAAYWGRNLRQPVLFAAMVQRLVEAAHTIFIEMSPHPILLPAIEETLLHLNRTGHTVPSLRRGQAEQVMMLKAFGRLYTLGYPTDWQRLYPSGGRIVSLPGYPWQRRHFWWDKPSAGDASSAWVPQHGATTQDHPLLGWRLPPLATMPGSYFWVNKVDARFHNYLRRNQIEEPAALPDKVYAEMALAAATAALGKRSHIVSELVSYEPLGLSRAAEPALQFVLTAENNDLASFQVFSRDGDAEWRRHAAGKIEVGQVDADWLYQVEWQPEARGQSSERPSGDGGRWLILADQGGIGTSLAALLAERGAHSVLVYPGDTFANPAEGVFSIDPARPEDWRRLLDEALGAERPSCRGVVHLWALGGRSPADLTAATLQEVQALTCGSVLHLIQALSRLEWSKAPHLWLVTQNAQPVGAAQKSLAVDQSTLWGLGRVIAVEQPDVWGGLVDLDSDTAPHNALALLQELWEPASEDQLAFRDGQRYVARLVRQRSQPLAGPMPARLRPDGSYLITGGLGGLGLKVAQWLVAQGARHLALMGRRPPTSQANAILQELEQAGAHVMIVRGDVSQAEQLANVLAEIDRAMPPLRGVVHTAGVLDDGVLQRQDWGRFASVLAPKVEGAWNLHCLTQAMPLDFFVLFSSVASLLGTPSQGNYAAANAFLDVLAHYRRAQGMPALTVNWGLWGEVGLAVQAGRSEALARRGYQAMTPQQGIAALAYLLRQDATQGAVLAVNWATYLAQLPPGSETTLLRDLAQKVEIPAAVELPPGQKSEVLQQLEASAPGEQFELLSTFVRRQVATVMRYGADYPLELYRGFFQLGMDSLMAIELKNRLQTSLDCSLPSTLAFDYPTIATLTQHLLDKLSASPEPDAPEKSESHPEEMPAEIEELSRDELKALLDQELQSIDQGASE